MEKTHKDIQTLKKKQTIQSISVQNNIAQQTDRQSNINQISETIVGTQTRFTALHITHIQLTWYLLNK